MQIRPLPRFFPRAANRRTLSTLVACGLLASCSSGEEPSAATEPSLVTEDPSTTIAEPEPEPEVDAEPAGPEAPPTTLAPVLVPEAAVMMVSFRFSDLARWDDGERLSADDLRCTLEALRGSPDSADGRAYESVIEVRDVADGSVEMYFDAVVAGHHLLFDRVIRAADHDDCADVSADVAEPPTGAGPFRVEVWNAAQMILEPSEWAREEGLVDVDRVVLVPIREVALEAEVLRSGEVDLIFPDLEEGLSERLDDPNLAFELQAGPRVESLVLQSSIAPLTSGVFAEEVFRSALWMSIDRDLLLENVYDPIRSGISLLSCGPTVNEEWCVDGGEFDATFDPGAAAQLLTDAGWRFDAEGFWQDPTGGEVSIRWLVDPGHGRQNRLLEVLEPSLAFLGFRIEVVECRGDCVFEERLGALDYDMAFVTTADPPGVGPSLRRFTCAEVPGAVLGRNFGGWCDQEATALLKVVSASTDPDEIATSLAGVHRRLAETRQLLPMVRLPSAVAWRPDKLGPESVLRDVRSTGYLSLESLMALEDLDGDGQIVIGVERWPSCASPIAACGSDLWYRGTMGALVVPGIWESRDSAGFTPSPMVEGDPVVTMLG
ncbi:MAG: hypothetical protein ISQ15_06445 [Ilumatobacteraceae bacterium]|nr:hypothetical protein [Ilumatobacteraceae bacterium]